MQLNPEAAAAQLPPEERLRQAKAWLQEILTKSPLQQREYTPSSPLRFTARCLDPKTIKTLVAATIKFLQSNIKMHYTGLFEHYLQMGSSLPLHSFTMQSAASSALRI